MNDKDVARELWLTAVETQKHFNELSLKVRQLSVSVVLAVLGVAVGVYSAKSELFGHLNRSEICAFLMIIAIVGLAAGGWLELQLYQKLLIGAVEFGEKLEKFGFSAGLPLNGIGMTGEISIAIGDRVASNGGTERRRKSQRVIFWFYGAGMIAFATLTAGFFLIPDESNISQARGWIMAGVFGFVVFFILKCYPRDPGAPNGGAKLEQSTDSRISRAA